MCTVPFRTITEQEIILLSWLLRPSFVNHTVSDYVVMWRTAYNQMEAASHLPGKRQLLAMFVDGLSTNSVSFIMLYNNVLNLLNDDTGLPSIQHFFDHIICIENNLLLLRL
jgi:hypothetical protein